MFYTRKARLGGKRGTSRMANYQYGDLKRRTNFSVPISWPYTTLETSDFVILALKHIEYWKVSMRPKKSWHWLDFGGLMDLLRPPALKALEISATGIQFSTMGAWIWAQGWEWLKRILLRMQVVWVIAADQYRANWDYPLLIFTDAETGEKLAEVEAGLGKRSYPENREMIHEIIRGFRA